MLKNDILLNKFISKQPKEFWSEVRRIEGPINNTKRTDGHSNPSDIFKNFDSKYRTILYTSESQTNPLPSVPALNSTTNTFLVNNFDNAIMRLKSTNTHNKIHTNHLNNACK